MFSRVKSPVQGDVVVSGNMHAVVWRITGDMLTLLPIVSDGGLRYRGDEAITEISDLVQIGFGGLDLVVRVSEACRVPIRNQIRIGRLSDRLLARVERAVDRECATAAYEARWEGVPKPLAAPDHKWR